MKGKQGISEKERRTLNRDNGKVKRQERETELKQRVSISLELVWAKFVLFTINKSSNPTVHLGSSH